jgi:hypothetical protein
MGRLGHARVIRAVPDDDTNARSRTESQSLRHRARNCSEWSDKLLRLASINAAIAPGLRRATLINPAGDKLIAAAHPSKRKGERPHYRALKIDNAQELIRALKAEEGSAFGERLFMV